MGCSFRNKKGLTIANAFQKRLGISKRKSNKYGLIKAVNFITTLLKNG